MKHELAILAVWLIAIVTTLLTVGGDRFTFLGPLFAICTIASVVIVRKARGAAG